MASYVKLAAEAGDKYLTALSDFQDNFLKSVATGAESVSAAKNAAGKTSFTAPAFELPAVPSAQEISDANFAFAQKLLKQQKAFVEKLLATTTVATN